MAVQKSKVTRRDVASVVRMTVCLITHYRSMRRVVRNICATMLALKVFIEARKSWIQVTTISASLGRT